MQRRKFGSHDLYVSALGFGAMRLPVLEGDPGKIDHDRASELIRYAIDHGVDYVDTAYPYHREQSEIFLGQVLQGGYREKINLATKCPTWLIQSRDDFDRYLNTQLERLKTDHLDVYLLHSLNKERWDSVVKHGVFDFLDRVKQDGRARFVGFSFHDDLATFKRIVDSYPWDVCQIQFNFMDEHFQAGVEGIKYAAARGLAVIVMEPLRGGRLVTNVPPEVQAVWDQAPVKRTPAEWALRWVWNHPEVSVVLSGMNAMEQVVENIRVAEDALPGSLSDEELALYDRVRQLYMSRVKIGCTQCRYCVPCPQNIVIPDLFEMYNEACMYASLPKAAAMFERAKSQMGDPANCVECGNCESKCPQNLPIRRHLKEILAQFAAAAKQA